MDTAKQYVRRFMNESLEPVVEGALYVGNLKDAVPYLKELEAKYGADITVAELLQKLAEEGNQE